MQENILHRALHRSLHWVLHRLPQRVLHQFDIIIRTMSSCMIDEDYLFPAAFAYSCFDLLRFLYRTYKQIGNALGIEILTVNKLKWTYVHCFQTYHGINDHRYFSGNSLQRFFWWGDEVAGQYFPWRLRFCIETRIVLLALQVLPWNDKMRLSILVNVIWPW